MSAGGDLKFIDGRPIGAADEAVSSMAGSAKMICRSCAEHRDLIDDYLESGMWNVENARVNYAGKVIGLCGA